MLLLFSFCIPKFWIEFEPWFEKKRQKLSCSLRERERKREREREIERERERETCGLMTFGENNLEID